MPEGLANAVNCLRETDEVVTSFATSQKVGLLAFIGPYTSVRVSPVHEARARINLFDEFAIEEALRVFAAREVKRIFLLVNSLGGGLDSSYKIARAVRQSFESITTFIPHVAASGGTLLALSGNEMVMGRMSNITPLDVQIQYKSNVISAATFMRSFKRASEWFEKITPEEAPYPKKALTDKLDPFLMEEWSGLMSTSQEYVTEVLEAVGYEDAAKMAEEIVTRYPSHNYVLTRDKAERIGLNAVDASQHQKAWNVMRYWLSKYLFEQAVTHCVRYAYPESIQNRPHPQILHRRKTVMPKKIDMESAAKLWGPLKNTIDKETLEVWKRLNPDSDNKESLETKVEKSQVEETEEETEKDCGVG